MNRRDRFNRGPIDEQTRRNIITGYIRRHKGCIAQDIVKGQTAIGRVKVFRLLNNLKREKVVVEERAERNKRDIKLFLNNDHPLVLVPMQLQEFEKNFKLLLKKGKKSNR